MSDADNCPQCGAVIALVGRTHLCKPSPQAQAEGRGKSRENRRVPAQNASLSGENKVLNLELEVERLRQENERLRKLLTVNKLTANEAPLTVNKLTANEAPLTVNKDRKAYMREYMRKRRTAGRKDARGTGAAD